MNRGESTASGSLRSSSQSSKKLTQKSKLEKNSSFSFLKEIFSCGSKPVSANKGRPAASQGALPPPPTLARCNSSRSSSSSESGSGSYSGYSYSYSYSYSYGESSTPRSFSPEDATRKVVVPNASYISHIVPDVSENLRESQIPLTSRDDSSYDVHSSNTPRTPLSVPLVSIVNTERISPRTRRALTPVASARNVDTEQVIPRAPLLPLRQQTSVIAEPVLPKTSRAPLPVPHGSTDMNSSWRSTDSKSNIVHANSNVELELRHTLPPPLPVYLSSNNIELPLVASRSHTVTDDINVIPHGPPHPFLGAKSHSANNLFTLPAPTNKPDVTPDGEAEPISVNHYLYHKLAKPASAVDLKLKEKSEEPIQESDWDIHSVIVMPSTKSFPVVKVHSPTMDAPTMHALAPTAEDRPLSPTDTAIELPLSAVWSVDEGGPMDQLVDAVVHAKLTTPSKLSDEFYGIIDSCISALDSSCSGNHSLQLSDYRDTRFTTRLRDDGTPRKSFSPLNLARRREPIEAVPPYRDIWSDVNCLLKTIEAVLDSRTVTS